MQSAAPACYKQHPRWDTERCSDKKTPTASGLDGVLIARDSVSITPPARRFVPLSQRSVPVFRRGIEGDFYSDAPRRADDMDLLVYA